MEFNWVQWHSSNPFLSIPFLAPTSQVLLHFWNPDRPGAKPKSVEQAAQLRLRLADEPAPPEPKFRAFLTALRKDWPSERTLAGPDDPRVPVWNGCPLLALEHQDMARLSLLLPADGGLHLAGGHRGGRAAGRAGDV